MPSNPNCCCPEVKEAFLLHHRSCSNRKDNKMYLGKYLNRYLHQDDGCFLDDSKKYKVCFNLKLMLDFNKIRVINDRSKEKKRKERKGMNQLIKERKKLVLVQDQELIASNDCSFATVYRWEII